MTHKHTCRITQIKVMKVYSRSFCYDVNYYNFEQVKEVIYRNR